MSFFDKFRKPQSRRIVVLRPCWESDAQRDAFMNKARSLNGKPEKEFLDLLKELMLTKDLKFMGYAGKKAAKFGNHILLDRDGFPTGELMLHGDLILPEHEFLTLEFDVVKPAASSQQPGAQA